MAGEGSWALTAAETSGAQIRSSQKKRVARFSKSGANVAGERER